MGGGAATLPKKATYIWPLRDARGGMVGMGSKRAYFPAMAVLPPLASPAAVWRDLKAFLGTRQKHQFLFAALAVLLPALIILGFYIDSDPGPRPPMTIYVQNYNGTRADSVIVAQQRIDQAEKDRALAARRAEWKRLQDKLGIE